MKDGEWSGLTIPNMRGVRSGVTTVLTISSLVVSSRQFSSSAAVSAGMGYRFLADETWQSVRNCRFDSVISERKMLGTSGPAEDFRH